MNSNVQLKKPAELNTSKNFCPTSQKKVIILFKKSSVLLRLRIIPFLNQLLIFNGGPDHGLQCNDPVVLKHLIILLSNVNNNFYYG